MYSRITATAPNYNGLRLLEEFHGPLTISQLEAAKVSAGWRCLEVGAGTGALTAWLAEQVAPTGRVLAIALETNWLESLRSEIVEVRRADITTTTLPRGSFDLVLAQMLLPTSGRSPSRTRPTPRPRALPS
jgi:protein-L-isoaspartate O-methyltransferase